MPPGFSSHSQVTMTRDTTAEVEAPATMPKSQALLLIVIAIVSMRLESPERSIQGNP
jgi:hypothetical protein